MPVTLTVVTPSFNQAKYLEETLRSVISQRDQIHEYFVYDGGSTDGSVDLIRKYQPYIDHWVSAKDAGQSDAIHKGFSRATGDVLCWINSDDVLLPGALTRVRAALEKNPSWDVLTGYHVRIDGNTIIHSLHRPSKETLSQARDGIQRIAQQTCFFRRKLYMNVGGLDLGLHCVMDFDLWYRFFRAGANWGHVPAYLAGYRWHSESKLLGGALNDRHHRELQLLAEEYPEYIPGGGREKMGLAKYRLRQVVSGRYLASALDSRRMRGKKLTDVFGDWVTPVEPVRRPASGPPASGI